MSVTVADSEWIVDLSYL